MLARLAPAGQAGNRVGARTGHIGGPVSAGGILERQRAAIGPAELATLSRVGMQTSDDWGSEFRLYGGNRILVQIGGRPVQVQIAAEMPPDPPGWSTAPIYLPVGSWTHSGRLGYWRFRSAQPGLAGVVSFTAFAEPRL